MASHNHPRCTSTVNGFEGGDHPIVLLAARKPVVLCRYENEENVGKLIAKVGLIGCMPRHLEAVEEGDAAFTMRILAVVSPRRRERLANVVIFVVSDGGHVGDSGGDRVDLGHELFPTMSDTDGI